MNPLKAGSFGAFFALLGCVALNAADYYVDPNTGNINNPGTSAQPWNTLEAVMVGKTFAAGDVIHLRSGYHGIPVVTGHHAAVVTIRAQHGHTPTVRRISFSNASRWVVSGLDISPLNGGGSYNSTLLVDVAANSSFITLSESKLSFATSVSGWSASDALSRLGSAISCHGQDCTFSNNRLSYVAWGIRIHPTAERATVRHNLIEEIMGDGIRFHASYGKFEYNTIINFLGVDDNHDDGIQGWSVGPGGTHGAGTMTGVEIRGNFICNNTVGAGRPLPETYGVHGMGLFHGMYVNLIVENNVVIVDKGHGIAVFGSINGTIRNNTVVKNPYALIQNENPWITVRHNQLYDNEASTGNMIVNNYYAGNPYTSLAIQGSTTSNNIVSTQYGNYFTDWSDLDLHLKSGSLAIDQGTSSNTPPLDRDGVGRSGNPDVGAYEYTAWPLLAARWRLDETGGLVAADSTPKGNAGLLRHGPAWGSGLNDGALTFDGGDDVVFVSHGTELDNMPAISVSAWIRPDTLGGGSKGRIVAKAEGIGPIAGWHLHLTDSNRLHFRADYATTDLERISANNAFILNDWTHVVVTWDGSATATGIKFYMNGTETGYVSSTNGSGARVDDLTSGLYVGNNATLARGFDGMLDDVRIYRGVLSSSQVSSLFEAASPLAASNLAATKQGYGQINLSWTDNAGNETGFRIERKKGAGGTYAEIATVGAVGSSGGTGTYNDTTAGAGTTYYYRVKAYNANGSSPASAEANATTDEITSGRIGHWKLDEMAGTSTADASGTGNTGALGTSPNNPAWTTGRIGGALDFDGTNDVVNAGSGSTLDNLAAVTVSAWIRADALGGGSRGRIVTKASGIGPFSGWHLHVEPSNRLRFRVDYATTDLDRMTDDNAIALGAWRHVVATWTGSATATNVKIYVDGVEISYSLTTNGAGSRVDDASSSFYLGNESGGTRAFDGLLDDVRVYNRVLSAAEIAAVHRAGL